MPAPAPAADAVPLLLSAADPAALRQQAGRLRHRASTPAARRLGDVAATLASTRTPLGHRTGVVAQTPDEAVAALTAIAAGESAPGRW